MIEVLFKDCLMLQDDIDELRLCMCINENTLLLVLLAIIFSLYTLSKKPKSLQNPSSIHSFHSVHTSHRTFPDSSKTLMTSLFIPQELKLLNVC